MIEQLRALIARHCETLRRELVEIERSVDTLCQDPEGSAELISHAIARSHKLKGGSGTIGFKDISASAARLERLLKMSLEISGPVPREILGEITKEKEALADLIGAVRPEQSGLFDVQLPTKPSSSPNGLAGANGHTELRSVS
ncbi:Hpt domain-containing protein [uncultured Cohaesibacter sp.]|uniref:Hpt domain-containing protein n=1 Tax=uncultured Cohaesibacter sp. TaxID=1002546 RepID=UPI0029C97BD1|nr:Hpt domain-containing protein [uncultured Cohaesibacter sp.]